jgi:hypothetical protein
MTLLHGRLLVMIQYIGIVIVLFIALKLVESIPGLTLKPIVISAGA